VCPVEVKLSFRGQEGPVCLISASEVLTRGELSVALNHSKKQVGVCVCVCVSRRNDMVGR